MSLGAGLAVSDLLYLISTSIFGVEAVAESAQSAIQFSNTLLGEEGIMAITNIINGQGGTGEEITTTFIRSMEAFQNIPEEEINNMINLGGEIWDETGQSLIADRVTVNQFTKSDFIKNILVIGKQLIKNGADMASNKGIEILKNIVVSILTKIKNSLNFKTITSTAAGVYIGDKIKEYFNTKAKNGTSIMKRAVKKVASKIYNIDQEGGAFDAGEFQIN